MMKIITFSFNRIESQVTKWIGSVDTAMLEMSKDKNAVVLENHRFKTALDERMEKFLKDTQLDLYEKGFKIQNVIDDRLRGVELELTRFRGSLVDFEEEVKYMQQKLAKDHADQKSRK